MTSEKLDEKVIFNVARRIERPEARAEYLQQVCGADGNLLERVETLLSAYEEQASFLESPVSDLTPTTDPSPIAEQPGTVVGAYKLLQQIGEGGMGVVFMAEQTEPIQRTVALKIIKPGMDTRQVIARFEAERQALAMMDHPNIAKVLDAGTTATGRPYFVMELVKGVPITKYCDEQQLSLRQRLELFRPVCEAVQHAHQKGIIHRDLKPTNVLVAEYDGRAIPKVIDFGVAKATAQKLTERTMFTEFGQVIGTVEYMSPEQAKFNQLDIDTRSDIYSLGVLLYELLAGSPPFEQKRLREAAFDEVLRIIREEEPPKPSARLSTTDELASIAASRGLEPMKLSDLVRGELDWVVMRCLEKDRNRRYESAGSLAREIERFLHDEPVQACPPSAIYRFRKFARRNRTLLAAVGAIAAALVVGLGLSTWMYLRERAAVQVAKSNEAQAKAVSDLMQEMLGSADAEQAKGIQYTVRELLDDFSARLGDQLADQPAVDADIHATIGRAYRSLRLPVQAQPHFEKAIELQRRVDGPQHAKLADMLVDYGWNFENQQKFNEAEAQLHKALEIYRAEKVTGIPAIHALRILELVMYSSGQNVAAESVYQQALAVVGRSDDERRELASLLTVYAGVLNKGRRYEEGEKVARQAVDMDRRLYGDQHPETAWGLRALGMALQGQQKLDEAEPVFRESLTSFRRFYADDHVYVQWVVGMLEAVLEARGDKSALEALASEEAERKSRSDSPDQQVRLAGLLLSSSPPRDAQEEEAHRLIRRAIEGYGKLAVRDGNNLNQRLTAVGHYMEVARICAVAPEFASELDEVKRILNAEYTHLLITFPDPKDTVDILYCFALARLRLGDQAGYRQACEAMSQVPMDELDGGHKFRRTWVWCLAPQPIEELRIPLNEAEDALAKDSYHARHTELIVLGGMLYRTGQYEQAAQQLEEFITAYPADPPPGERTINYERLLLAMTKWQQGHHGEARRMLAKTLPDIDEELQSSGIYWNRRASLEVLRQEAEDLIGSKEADEAVENNSRASDNPSNDNPTLVTPLNPER